MNRDTSISDANSQNEKSQNNIKVGSNPTPCTNKVLIYCDSSLSGKDGLVWEWELEQRLRRG
jgi:hypothetical protein